jgi:hypothetical protein
MVTNYNAPQTQYNKTDFAKLGIAESKNIKFSEAIYGGSDEKLVVLAWVTELPDVKNFDDKNFKFEPMACIFEILLKPFTWKEKTTEPTPGMLLAAHVLKSIEPGTPFSGHFDFSANQWDYDCIVTGSTAGQEIPEPMREMMKANTCPIVALEKLDKLQGKSLPEIRKGGSGGYSKGETTAERIAAKVAYLDKVAAGDDKLLNILAMAGMDVIDWLKLSVVKILD